MEPSGNVGQFAAIKPCVIQDRKRETGGQIEKEEDNGE